MIVSHALRPFAYLAALLACVFLAFSSPVWADKAAQDQANDIFQAARADKIGLKDAISQITALPGGQTDPVLVSFHGSLLTMRADEAWLPFRKLSFVNEGLDLLDQAAGAIKPDQDGYLRVYMTAALTNANVPGFLDRKDFANQYFTRVAAHRNFPNMHPRDRATVLAWRARLVGVSTAEGTAFAQEAQTLDAATASAILSGG